MEELQRAVMFATKSHAGQWRDGDVPMPYITHPLDVLVKLRHVGGVTEPTLLCAAVLHDVVEECAVSIGKIQSQFGNDVATLVRELTRSEPTASQLVGLSKSQIWEMRSEMLLDNIRNDMSADAQCVKLADRLSNLEEALRTRTGDKLSRYFAQTHRILAIIPATVNPTLYHAVYSLANAHQGQ